LEALPANTNTAARIRTPATQTLKNPIDGSNVHLGSGKVFQRGNALLEALELQPDFAVRRADAVVRGWKLGTPYFLHTFSHTMENAPINRSMA
jgi:hypothetical protein